MKSNFWLATLAASGYAGTVGMLDDLGVPVQGIHPRYAPEPPRDDAGLLAKARAKRDRKHAKRRSALAKGGEQ